MIAAANWHASEAGGTVHTEPTTLGEYLEAKAIAYALKNAREHAKISLADVAAATGMDRATISRLENAVYLNTTINTINRLAGAYGKHFVFRLEEGAVDS
jgi:DNA-binding Xre family transcriptional regulator